MNNPFERIRTEKVFLMMPVQLLPAMEAIQVDQVRAEFLLFELEQKVKVCSSQVQLLELTGYMQRTLVLIQNNKYMMEVLSTKLPQA